MIRIYTASKLSEAEMWLALHRDEPNIYCHARWLKHSQVGTPDTELHARQFWLEDEEDVRSADVVVVFAREGQHLRGALVEAGMGIALKKYVIVVGEHIDYGTWQFHPQVECVVNFEALIDKLKHIEKIIRLEQGA